MSLVMTSSNWINGEQPRKRIPTIRKTIKQIPRTIETLETEFDSTDTLYNDNIDEENDINRDTRNMKVNELLEKMSSIKANDDGDYLENFTPLSYPEHEEKTENSILPSDYATKRRHITNSNFIADKAADNHSDFNRIYEVSTNKPSYSTSIGLGTNNESKITDRLSYIVHLLEQQQNEKTNNVLEEYVLYILLGTFVIFVVDSFSRGGKYVR